MDNITNFGQERLYKAVLIKPDNLSHISTAAVEEEYKAIDLSYNILTRLERVEAVLSHITDVVRFFLNYNIYVLYLVI